MPHSRTKTARSRRLKLTSRPRQNEPFRPIDAPALDSVYGYGAGASFPFFWAGIVSAMKKLFRRHSE